MLAALLPVAVAEEERRFLRFSSGSGGESGSCLRLQEALLPDNDCCLQAELSPELQKAVTATARDQAVADGMATAAQLAQVGGVSLPERGNKGGRG